MSKLSAKMQQQSEKPVDYPVHVQWNYSDSEFSSTNESQHPNNRQFEETETAFTVREDEFLIPNQNEIEDHHVEIESSTRKREEQEEDETKMFTFRSPELRAIKLFLPGTLQKIVPQPAAVLLVLVSFIYCLHVFGVFHEKTLVQEEIKLTLTTFKNIIWTLRIPVFTFFGFCHLKMYLNDIPSSFRFTLRNLKSVRVKILLWCVVEAVLTVGLPAITRFAQMKWLPTTGEKKDPFDTATAVKNTVILALARVIVLPIFVNFIAEFYLLYYQVRQYEEDVQKWKQGMQEARNYFIDIQDKIKKAEKTFQLFLAFHLGILILIFVPGVLSYVERFNTEGTVDRMFLTQNAMKMSDPIIAIDPVLMNNQSTARLLAVKKPGQGQMFLLSLRQNQLKNKTTREEGPKQILQEHTKRVADEKARKRIILAALTFLGELMALYLPLVLLGKINQTLTSIPQTIRYGLKYDEQLESGYLIRDDQVVKEMLKTMEHVDGFQILGMRLTVVKTLLIAVLAPLLTLLIHIMIRDVDISP